MSLEPASQFADAIRAYRVREFCAAVGISRSTFHKFERLGKIGTIRIGGRVLVPHAEALRIASEGLSAPKSGVSSTEAA